MVNHFMTLIVGSDVQKLDKVIEKHNQLVESYKEHGFYNNENPFELYQYLMKNTVK
jgi:spore coat protein CotF